MTPGEACATGGKWTINNPSHEVVEPCYNAFLFVVVMFNSVRLGCTTFAGFRSRTVHLQYSPTRGCAMPLRFIDLSDWYRALLTPGYLRSIPAGLLGMWNCQWGPDLFGLEQVRPSLEISSDIAYPGLFIRQLTEMTRPEFCLQPVDLTCLYLFKISKSVYQFFIPLLKSPLVPLFITKRPPLG